MTTPWWYNAVLWLLKPVYRLRLKRKASNAAAYAAECAERFGPFTAPRHRHAIWFHAVSVGETNAAQPLIDYYLHAGYAVLLTNTTQTGQARAKALFAEHPRFQALYLPVDQRAVMREFMQLHQPQVLLLMETELWPNLCAIANELNIRMLLCNARLSEKSARGYGKVAALTRPMLDQLSLVLAQDAATQARYIDLGLAQHKSQVLGNIKFDIQAPAAQLAAAEQLRNDWHLSERKVLVLASTHAPEEQDILQALKPYLEQHPHWLCIVVPRHPQRFDVVYQLMTELGLSCHRRSLGQAVLPSQQVYLADSMGELWLWYALADACFVGASLNTPGGGHNMLEPMALNVPTVLGPRYQNFQSIVDELQAAQGVTVAEDAAAVAKALANLLQQPEQAQQLTQQATQVMARNQGALQRHIAAIAPFLQAVPQPLDQSATP